MLLHQRPVAGSRLDAEAVPKIPIVSGCFAGGIENDATGVLAALAVVEQPLRRGFGCGHHLAGAGSCGDRQALMLVELSEIVECEADYDFSFEDRIVTLFENQDLVDSIDHGLLAIEFFYESCECFLLPGLFGVSPGLGDLAGDWLN
jgi:hypothetical protein